MALSSLERGRQAFDALAWGEAYAEFRSADLKSPLGAEDLERAGRAAYLTGRDEDFLVFFERAFHERIRRDEPDGAALTAFWLIFGLLTRGQMARASGWVARAQRLVEDDAREGVARGYLLAGEAVQMLQSGDAETAYATFRAEREFGRQHGEADLVALAGFGEGQALITLGRVREGVALLDETMLAVTAGETSPIVAGLVYCGVIAACMETFDPRRAKEWTTALQNWCDAQPDLMPYRGQCLVHRAQIMQLHGAWLDARHEAQHALERLSEAGSPAAGDALYEQAELQRLCGEFDSAEESYRRASQFGRDAQPGLALLRLAQRDVDTAVGGIRRAVDETGVRFRRPPLLAACVEILLATQNVPAAREAADELATIADDLRSSQLQAMSAYAIGSVLLAEGDPTGALAAARHSWSLWRSLDAPYEAARTRVVVGMACRALGDEDAAQMELDAASQVFDSLSAGPELARIATLVGRTAVQPASGLTSREVEVLRLVATGKTNRAIAAELYLSEKTIARHLSNIFAKTDLTSRAAATAFAYENDLL